MKKDNVDLEREIVRCEIERSASEAEFLQTASPGAFVGMRDWADELEIVKREARRERERGY